LESDGHARTSKGGRTASARTGGAPGRSAEAATPLSGLTIRETEIRLMLADIRRDLSLDSIAPDDALRLLGFDSLDFIQVAVRIHQRYRVRLGGLDENARDQFETLRILAHVVDAQMSSRVPDAR